MGGAYAVKTMKTAAMTQGSNLFVRKDILVSSLLVYSDIREFCSLLLLKKNGFVSHFFLCFVFVLMAALPKTTGS